MAHAFTRAAGGAMVILGLVLVTGRALGVGWAPGCGYAIIVAVEAPGATIGRHSASAGIGT